MGQLPVGADIGREGVRFRVWAPNKKQVRVLLEDGGRALLEVPLTQEERGYFSLTVPSARPGMLYRFKLDDEAEGLPDPASRFQPEGPEGPSQIIDPSSFEWTDTDWTGVDPNRQILYELHVGTFTEAGTWRAAIEHLPYLCELGITTIEVMPIAEFAGRFGWGYDGVDLFAPTHLYGLPDDARAFVNAAHRTGLGVILDVVYNHLGPRGNYLPRFAPPFFNSRYGNEWGDALNFDGEDAFGVREFIVSNAAYWIDEFHFDGLRLDATQQIFDGSKEHVLAEVSKAARKAARGRSIVLMAENERQDARLVEPYDRGGYGLDAIWNEDYHHAAMVALTGRREAYYTDYAGSPQEFVSMAKWGFLYQGQWYSWQRQARGTPAFGVKPAQMVTFLQNHDQVANSLGGDGARMHQLASPGASRAMTALWLLSPGTPLFFQGQEFQASSPFLFFADHQGDLGQAVREGRAGFMRQFGDLAVARVFRECDPGDEATFRRSVLCHAERERHSHVLAFHRDLLAIRTRDRAFQPEAAEWLDGAVLGPSALALRFFSADPRGPGGDFSQDRLLLVNLGSDLDLNILNEPLLASPPGTAWRVFWSSEDRAYGGIGTGDVAGHVGKAMEDILDNSQPNFEHSKDGRWKVPGQAAVLLGPRARSG